MTRALALGLLLAGACAGDDDVVCNADADCASRLCRPDGTCMPVEDPGPVDAGAWPLDASPLPDAGDAGDGGVRDAAPAGCVPDHDGVIARLEVPLEAGLRATFRIATDATVDTSGQVRADGSRRWDLATPLGGDHDALVELAPLDASWFAPSFPGATYATRLSEREDLLGVFEITASALLLRGVASPAKGVSRTRVAHNPPVPVLRFPLSEGMTWSAHASVSGVALGVPALWSEDYDYAVDAHGELATPFGTFPVLRVRITMTRTVGLLVTTIRSFAFVAECFGTVASITSGDGETREEFSRAAEVRRLAP